MMKKLPLSFTLIPALPWVVLVSVPSPITTNICRPRFSSTVFIELFAVFIEHFLGAGTLALNYVSHRFLSCLYPFYR